MSKKKTKGAVEKPSPQIDEKRLAQLKEDENSAKLLIKLMDKGEFKFSAVDAVLFAKVMDWLRRKTIPADHFKILGMENGESN